MPNSPGSLSLLVGFHSACLIASIYVMARLKHHPRYHGAASFLMARWIYRLAFVNFWFSVVMVAALFQLFKVQGITAGAQMLAPPICFFFTMIVITGFWVIKDDQAEQARSITPDRTHQSVV